MMKLGLAGKSALVLGGSSGIGLGIAKALAGEGTRILIASRSETKLAEAAVQIEKAGAPSVHTFVVDTTKPAEVERFAEAMTDDRYTRGAIDILVNNTGGPATGKPLDIAVDEWDQAYHSLLRSVIVMSQRLLPAMQARGWGRVLTITSTSARELIPGLPVSSVFRSALTAWTKEVSKQVGLQGVLVNNLLPGPVVTERLQQLAAGHGGGLHDTLVRATALGRPATPDEIGNVAAFLCSDANQYITGSDVLVDGGVTRAL